MPYMLDGRQLRVGRSFTHPDGRQFGGNWNKYSSDTLTSLGITYEADPAPYDSTYYVSAGVARDLAEVKTNAVTEQKQIAGIMLNRTDWYVTRKVEKDTAIPSNVTTYRDAVRTACAARESEINGAADVAALETLMKASPRLANGDVNSAALTQWPDALS
jgi:hypothetical protein